MESMAMKTKTGNTVYVVHFAEDESPMDADTQGMCIACGNFQDGCEPDARGYECEGCGQSKVYGIEELVLMGYCK